MKKILFIIGSLRAKSFNRQVARVAKEIIGGSAQGSGGHRCACRGLGDRCSGAY